MSSSVPVEVIDDDDDFDWDAAVREIDAACGAATTLSSSGVTSTSAPIYRNANIHTGSCPKTENNKPASSRQSTLDRFVGLTGLKSANQDVRHDAQDKVECNDEISSSVSIDPEAAKTWIYPVAESIPVRDYQASITKTALFSNTLVSLPTGLGKTLIAAVVMYNYYRWFPEDLMWCSISGKIVFAAPSRPLVTQQIEACHKIVGIPQEYTVDMTGQICPSKRADIWKKKRIFFLTPQVLDHDIDSGTCDMKKLVCLVLDEAHRASGDYAYCVAVRKLMAVPVQLRLLALTATPGSKYDKVQKVIDNLQISSLEHRSESDPDVAPYVHKREFELIQVEMGKDAEEVYDLLSNVMHRFHSRLSVLGVLSKPNAHKFSPTVVLDSREKFRQAPPQNMPPSACGEVEGNFAVLLALYHIRKMLSGYGIRPTFEALEEKLKQKSFAGFMKSNDIIWKARAIMQQYMSRGELSPKFLKLLQVLVDHFKKHDSQKSRVIIFSNYRDSVSEIMDSLAKIGSYIKATEFIGQSSGKTSKGQTQKVQQAVLEKFRSGGYNVIVATSIGEEGLDIMEVDLVICFDANVSSLRMIQRMGRTGAELDGYRNKQAGGKAIKKHMANGGTNSFRFHPSPRMVPRIFKPEKVLAKLLIKDFVSRGKKVRNDVEAIQTPKYKLKLTDMETDLLAKYFQSSSENDWRPSLIAFPHFQAFPSRVHKVAHSMTTGMLIDTMHNLQELSFNHHPDEETSQGYLKSETIEHHDTNIREDDGIQKEAESDILLLSSPMQPDVIVQSQKACVHSFLFGSDFTSVDSLGRVIILSTPSFPLTKNIPLPNPSVSDFTPVKIQDPESAFEVNDGFTTPVKSQRNDDDDVAESSRRNLDAVLDDIDLKAVDLSPRLTNILLSGVVPESPVAKGTSSNGKGYPTTPDHETGSPKCVSSIKFVGETTTPVTKLSDNSCSKDWMLNSGEMSVSQPKPRFKRLRKYGDIKAGNLSEVEVVGRTSCAPFSNKRSRGDKKVLNDGRIFIDNEAEVSSEGSGDEDEGVDQGQDSYEDSFIDDRINPTVATQAECDMMAIYRRSLLTQSPATRTPQFPVDEGGSTSRTTNTNNYSTSVSFNTARLTSDAGIPTTTTGITSTDSGIWKRKSSFSHGHSHSLPIRNLDKEISLDAESRAKEPPWKTEGEAMDDFDSDEFYRNLDFDALEEEASRQLRLRSAVSQKMKQTSNDQNLDCPSFDLGI
ncbi:hypothetical protein LXL04_020120 [Taraxacum kok-saghyz]